MVTDMESYQYREWNCDLLVLLTVPCVEIRIIERENQCSDLFIYFFNIRIWRVTLWFTLTSASLLTKLMTIWPSHICVISCSNWTLQLCSLPLSCSFVTFCNLSKPLWILLISIFLKVIIYVYIWKVFVLIYMLIYMLIYIYIKRTTTVIFCVSACSDFNQKQNKNHPKPKTEHWTASWLTCHGWEIELMPLHIWLCVASKFADSTFSWCS